LESKADGIKRIQAVMDEILSQSEEDVLIVSHGALMMFMRKELLKRGFKGPRLKTPENGKLYIFEK
jgi:broad specificity phosphatase PhoE